MNLITTHAYNNIINNNNNNNDNCNNNIVMLRIIRLSNFFRISVYKQKGNWITIALTSCVWTNRTDIACPCDKRVDIEQEINNKYSQQDLVSSSGMKILLVEDEGCKCCPFCFGALGTILKTWRFNWKNINNSGIELALHFKEQSCWDQQESSKVSLKFKVACCHPINSMGLKFLALTYLLWSMHKNKLGIEGKRQVIVLNNIIIINSWTK